MRMAQTFFLAQHVSLALAGLLMFGKSSTAAAMSTKTKCRGEKRWPRLLKTAATTQCGNARARAQQDFLSSRRARKASGRCALTNLRLGNGGDEQRRRRRRRPTAAVAATQVSRRRRRMVTLGAVVAEASSGVVAVIKWQSNFSPSLAACARARKCESYRHRPPSLGVRRRRRQPRQAARARSFVSPLTTHVRRASSNRFYFDCRLEKRSHGILNATLCARASSRQLLVFLCDAHFDRRS